jgi:hypothetical protein
MIMIHGFILGSPEPTLSSMEISEFIAQKQQTKKLPITRSPEIPAPTTPQINIPNN